MKKVLIILLSGIVCISVLVFAIFDIPKMAIEFFWGRLDREHTIKLAQNNYNSEILYFWEDGFFFITEYQTKKILSFLITAEKTGNCSLEKVLEGVSKYKKVKNKFYVIAEEGYAVIDENNICRAFIIEECESYRRDKHIEDDLVIYLESKNDFSKEEIEIFDKMEP